jgi:hypothetical protein
MTNIACGIELTGGVHSSNLWGGVDVVVRGLVGSGGEIKWLGGDLHQKLNIEPHGLNIGAGRNCFVERMGETNVVRGGWFFMTAGGRCGEIEQHRGD